MRRSILHGMHETGGQDTGGHEPAGHHPVGEERWIRPPHGGGFPITDTGEPAAGAAGMPPLVILPGIGGPRGAFYHQVAAFRATRRVVTLNLNPMRGRGMRAIDSAAQDILAALDSLELERADLVGASFGTTVVTRFALEHPARVRRLTWVAPPVVSHPPWWRGTFGPGWLVGGTLLVYAPTYWHAPLGRFLSRHRIYSPEPELTPRELELMAGRVADIQIAPFFGRLAELARWDWAALPAPFPSPLLVIQGRSESRVTPPAARAAWTRASGREVAVVPGHHMPYLSYPMEFNDVLGAFLRADFDRDVELPIHTD
jgi:pimeloyl-ACP methyl ester carboxylesterase